MCEQNIVYIYSFSGFEKVLGDLERWRCVKGHMKDLEELYKKKRLNRLRFFSLENKPVRGNVIEVY